MGGAAGGAEATENALRAPSLSSLAAILILTGGVGFLLARTRRLESVCDARGEPLEPQRVRAGMAVVLALALSGLIHGDPGVRSAAFLWAAFVGPLLGRRRGTAGERSA